MSIEINIMLKTDYLIMVNFLFMVNNFVVRFLILYCTCCNKGVSAHGEVNIIKVLAQTPHPPFLHESHDLGERTGAS